MSDALSSGRQKQLVLTGTGSSTEYLDDFDNIIVEILSWLPAKSLLRFRCVCKAWRALISESYFISKHLSRNNTKLSASYSLLGKDDFFRSVECESILKWCLSHNDGLPPTRRLDFPVLDPLIEFNHTRPIGSCNGLICVALVFYESSFMLWNPCTGESQVLPLPQPPLNSKSHRFMGFGYDSTTVDYKVILGSFESGHKHVLVFSLKRGSWRELELERLDRYDRYFNVRDAGVLAYEALHWVLNEENVRDGPSKIVSFDLADEKFHEIPFPYPPNPDEKPRVTAKVGTFNDCLTLHFQTWCPDFEIDGVPRPGCKLQMWVMKHYGVKEWWTEVINFPSGALNEYICGTCISEKGEVLVLLLDGNDGGSLALYNPDEQTCKTVMENGFHIATYIETLVSPLIGGTDASM